MGKRRERTLLEQLAKVLTLNDLRLRIAADLPNTREQRQLALQELTEAHDTLGAYIEQLRTGRRRARMACGHTSPSQCDINCAQLSRRGR